MSVCALTAVLMLPLTEKERISTVTAAENHTAAPAITPQSHPAASAGRKELPERAKITWTAYLKEPYSTERFIGHMTALGHSGKDQSYSIRRAFRLERPASASWLVVEARFRNNRSMLVVLETNTGRVVQTVAGQIVNLEMIAYLDQLRGKDSGAWRKAVSEGKIVPLPDLNGDSAGDLPTKPDLAGDIRYNVYVAGADSLYPGLSLEIGIRNGYRKERRPFYMLYLACEKNKPGEILLISQPWPDDQAPSRFTSLSEEEIKQRTRAHFIWNRSTKTFQGPMTGPEESWRVLSPGDAARQTPSGIVPGRQPAFPGLSF